jgi:arylformamidase
MDVFAPTDLPNRPLPVLVYIHGGGWTHGAKEWMTFMAPALTRYPAILVVPSYGLAPAHTHPEPVVDCLRALVCTRQKAAEFGGDPDRLFVGGHSVGGHISAMIALGPIYARTTDFLTKRFARAFPSVDFFAFTIPIRPRQPT